MQPLVPQQHYGTIVIVGGGCYGSYYLRQLGRAARAGALTAERVVIVDRDEHCRVSSEKSADDPFEVAIAVEEWTPFFDSYLGAAAARLADAAPQAPDAIVPSPLMPHLMYEWLARRARDRVAPARCAEWNSMAAPRRRWHAVRELRGVDLPGELHRAGALPGNARGAQLEHAARRSGGL